MVSIFSISFIHSFIHYRHFFSLKHLWWWEYWISFTTHTHHVDKFKFFFVVLELISFTENSFRSFLFFAEWPKKKIKNSYGSWMIKKWIYGVGKLVVWICSKTCIKFNLSSTILTNNCCYCWLAQQICLHKD